MIHHIPIDDDIKERLREFNLKLPHDQKIISMVTSDKYLFITTEKIDSRQQLNDASGGLDRNLLRETFRRGHNST